MVEEPPRPSPAGSNASATSVCINQLDITGDLPHVPAENAKPRRLCDAVAMGVPGAAGSGS